MPINKPSKNDVCDNFDPNSALPLPGTSESVSHVPAQNTDDFLTDEDCNLADADDMTWIIPSGRQPVL